MKPLPQAALLLMTTAISSLASKPNVILIFTDDHGYADLGSQGIFSDLETPHFDTLANGGARMTDGYASAPQCVPSRGGLMTGIYQNRFGLESNPEMTDPKVMKRFTELPTVAERLKMAGYATGMAGKWHLGPGKDIVRHGFDKVFYKNSGRPGITNMNLDGSDLPLGPEKTGLYHLDACSAAACGFIDRFKDQPFFFYLAYRAPHVPLDAPEKYLNRFPGKMPERRRQALAMISAMDDGVGRILETLRRHKIEENTLIFVIGDNGAPLKIHKLDAPGGGPGWDGSLNDPLNGEKGMLSEGGIRTPFIVYWKDTIPPGQVYRHPVISLDATATTIALAGLPNDPSLDGVNLAPHLTGNATKPPHEALFWRWLGQSAIRKGSWKYLRSDDREYLFNLEDDAEEKHNLVTSKPELAQSLKAELESWTQELSPPGLWAVKSEGMSRQAGKYFDWYFDGKRDAPSPKPPTASNDSVIFKQRDKDRNGEVTWAEFLAGRTGDKVPEIRRHFDRRDFDQNGIWEQSEVSQGDQARD